MSDAAAVDNRLLTAQMPRAVSKIVSSALPLAASIRIGPLQAAQMVARGCSQVMAEPCRPRMALLGRTL